MHIAKANPKQLPQLIGLFKLSYPRHNIFTLSKEEISHYLSLQAQKHLFLTLIEEDEKGVEHLLAASLVVKTGESQDKNHTRWKFRHFAFVAPEHGATLLKECEKHVFLSSISSKIELTISESEAHLNFYKKQGYHQEAALSNHYRWGETCFILSKSFKRENKY